MRILEDPLCEAGEEFKKVIDNVVPETLTPLILSHPKVLIAVYIELLDDFLVNVAVPVAVSPVPTLSQDTDTSEIASICLYEAKAEFNLFRNL